LEGLGSILDGPAALAYGGDSVVGVARELVKWAKKIKALELCGAILDGEVFEGGAGVSRLSKFPTREEAQAKVVQLVLSPAQRLVGAATGPGAKIAGILDEIKTRLEDGKTIEKAG
jgi:large subunit ribosomal protein L10